MNKDHLKVLVASEVVRLNVRIGSMDEDDLRFVAGRLKALNDEYEILGPIRAEVARARKALSGMPWPERERRMAQARGASAKATGGELTLTELGDAVNRARVADGMLPYPWDD